MNDSRESLDLDNFVISIDIKDYAEKDLNKQQSLKDDKANEVLKDYPIWEVIQKGNGHVQVSTDTTRQIRVLPPKTVEETLATERERKARNTLIMSIPEDHLAKFHKMTDAKEMWEAIKSIFGGNDESKKMQKYILKQQFESFSVSNSEGLHKGYDRFQSLLSQLETHGACVSTEDANQKFLRSLPASWSQVSLIMRTKPGVDNLSFDDLYNNLRDFKSDVKGSTGSYSSSSSYTNELMYSFFANQSSGPLLDHEDLEQVDELDLEEMHLKWQVAMISMRLKKFYKKTGRKLQFDAKEPIGFDKTKGTLDLKQKTMRGDLENRRNLKLCLETKVKTCLKEYEESYAKLKKLYDEQREELVDASIEIQAYTQALKKVEAQLVCHQKNQLVYEEKIRYMKVDLDDKTNVLIYHKKLLAEAVKEKEELKTKLGNFQSSSKGLSKLLNSQMSAKDKSGLGYGDKIHEGVLSYENEVLKSVFDSRSSDVEDNHVNDRFAKDEGMHVVPPPMIRIYMPSKSDLGIDESKFTYGLKQSKTSESEANTSDFASCESDSSVETLELVPKLVVNEPKVVSKPKVWSDAPIIEEYESDSDDETVIKPSREQEKPSFAFINNVKHIKTPRESVKEQNTCSPNPKAVKRDWNGLMSKRIGLGYGFTRKACFVCGSFGHLIRDCNFHEKRMAKQVELNKLKGKSTGQGEKRPVWNNVQRLNHQNKFVPKAVLTKTDRFPINAARQNLSSKAAATSTVRKVNTARPIMNDNRPRNNFYKSHSPIRRPFNRTTAPKANFTNHKVNTAGVKTVSAVGGKRETAVKASAGCNWRYKRHYWIRTSKYNSGSYSSKNANFKDPLGRPKHMTRNKAFLIEYQDYNGGLVAFGGSKGHITGKGDKKNKVLFTDSECLVLSPDFKLPDENQVLLRVPRQNNMYSFNLENIIPNGGLACLIAKAKVDESNKWHRRLEFKNMDIIEFCGSKGIKREYNNARTPQQNRVAGRKNRTLIEVARTMLADLFLPNIFWAEAVSTACYVLNRVLVTKLQNKTPYELITGKIPIISYIRPFWCHVTILNTIDHLGKFEEKSDEGFLVGYSLNSKAFRVYNLETKSVEENLHINLLENKPNVTGKGPNWLFNLDYLTDSINYQPVTVENIANKTAGLKEANHSTVKSSEAKNGDEKSDGDNDLKSDEEPEVTQCTEDLLPQEGAARATSTNTVNTVRTPTSPLRVFMADFTNLKTTVNVSPIPTSRIHSIHTTTQILRDPTSAVQTRSKVNKSSGAHAFIEPKKISQALEDESWVDAMQEELLQFKIQKGYRQEEGIDYDEVFALVARIEAIRIFLAFASYMGFIVYQMDVKSAFLYGTIDEEVYVSQPPGFVDPKFPKKVYKVVKALYGLHQAPRAWYATLSTFLLKSGYRRGTIDKTLFIKKDKNDIMLVQVYVDDIIFGSTKKSWCDEFEALMKSRFQMSSMGELTFFLGLQVKQKEDGIFISQDKYVAEILKKFDFASVKTASTPIETQKPFDGTVNKLLDWMYHLYRSRWLFNVLDCFLGLILCLQSVLINRFQIVIKLEANLDRKRPQQEYVAAANCCGQVLWIQNQMLDYGFNFMNIMIYIDNESTICIVKNPMFHSETKHIKIRHHFIRDAYEKKLIQVLKIHTDDNVADLLTKAFEWLAGQLS
ncbi:putative ribonuclease H-like domain-containing protein [Tanacetum coccineum]